MASKTINDKKNIPNKSTPIKKWEHSIVWFRNDLRIKDNPALFSACKRSKKITALFLIAEKQWLAHDWSARRIYLTLKALEDLSVSLAKLGIKLEIFSIDNFKDSAKNIKKITKEKGIDAVYFNAEYALNEKKRDEQIIDLCRKQNIHLGISHGSIIIPPHSIRTKSGTPYKIFTPFKREWIQMLIHFDRSLLNKPSVFDKSLSKKIQDDLQKNKESILSAFIKKYETKISALDLYFDESAAPEKTKASENFAHKLLNKFIESKIINYDEQRDIPFIDGTSSLSPALTVGLISPRTCFQAAREGNNGYLENGIKGYNTWINEIIWREFYLHLLADFPEISINQPLKKETRNIPWRHDKQEFEKWCEGKTGFPLVDAAMRQLNTTGWMHNRLRMVTATFLTKYLLIDWRMGEKYFMQQLYDGHFASNNGGWQWSASTGTDAAPYFRILSPIRQAERFDKECAFIKKYIPELKSLPPKIIHQPGHEQLLATGYPAPMVDLKEGKERCLQAFKFALNG